MAYHFPLMPRLYMALRRGDATSLVDILTDTPAIPDGCQWGIFLRNHDELTLEMVTPEERDYMWREYAPDPPMKSNLGIRRRLATLLDGDRARIELLHSLLLSLPGSPFLYYGDEIGMGDDYSLPDRDGLRTPMQWAAGPTAGFSTAEPDDLYLPVISAPGFGPDAVNVADQRTDSHSLLNWIRSMLALRSAHPVLGSGSFELVATSQKAAFAFLRVDDAEKLLVVANFSAEPLQVTFDPEIGRASTSIVGDSPVDLGNPVALAGHECRWISIS
jgi:maltose alpha-D-glucosyltransferase/alpha-amylase